ncbi:hypothetical protein [Actinophytocola sp.]|uniref:hypothetical protein n=1 Tax=Actinophytocola sp. TaxID=1872138 RepID=UPI003D6C4A6A
MADFEVDVDEVRRAGTQVRGLGDSLAEADSLKYLTAPDEVGDDELARALAKLHRASRRSTDDLRELSEKAASRLADTANEYERLDQAVANTLRPESSAS